MSTDGRALSGRTALVTGAGRGIGAAIARRLAADGAAVALAARSTHELEAVVESIHADGGRAASIAVDLTESGAAERVVAFAVESFGGLDLLVNNAGGAHRVRPLDALDDDTFALGTELNYGSAFRVMRAAAPHLFASEAAGGAAVLNVVSIAAERGLEGMSYYGGAKAALASMSRTVAREWGPRGVRVNCLGPGWIDTDLSRPLLDNADFVRITLERVPLGRFGTPQDIAGTAAFLLSDAAAYITGSTLFVDGGLLA